MTSLAVVSFTSISMLFVTHWASIQFYAYYCAPPGFYGLIDSFVKSVSPICIGVNYIQFYAIKYYYVLWMSMIISFCKLVHEKINKYQEKISGFHHTNPNSKRKC